jgi:hypothetical protein
VCAIAARGFQLFESAKCSRTISANIRRLCADVVLSPQSRTAPEHHTVLKAVAQTEEEQ